MIQRGDEHEAEASRTDGAYVPDGDTQTRPPRPAVTGDNAASAMDQFKLSMRQFTEHFATLPFQTRATCPGCGEVVDATYTRTDGGVAVGFDCGACDAPAQFHHDGIYTHVSSDRPGSARHTLSGVRIRPNLRGLPRTVETLCPECRAILVGRYFVEDGAVWIEKTCPVHGHFRDCVNRHVEMYAKATYWSFQEHAGQQHPHVRGGGNCPSDCGLCGGHQSSACLANIDLTNRCNLSCPICFANAGASGYVYQPSFEQIVAMLQQLRDLRPTPATAVQFSGGEPTIHPEFHRIVSAAREMGFSNIQIATNGLTHANAAFADKSVEAGLHTLYLQFDGVGEAAHEHTRNHPGIWQKKLACIENCRRVGMKVCLVPTIIRGVNDDQVGAILRFAIENIDVVSAISYQPVSFSGRMDEAQLTSQRYTLGDLADDIADESGCEPLRDMFPLSIVVPLAQMLQALTGDPKIRPSAHTDCAFGTYFLVSPDGTPYAFPQVVDVEGMFTDMNRIARRIATRGKVTHRDKLTILTMFKRHFNEATAPPGLTVKKFMRTLKGLVDKDAGRGEGQQHTYKTLLCAGMHFQDCYNFDAERVKRCVILYSTPEGLYPFCTYNCGPGYRHYIERMHARNQNHAGDDAQPALSAKETS